MCCQLHFVWQRCDKMSNVVSRTKLSTTVMADIQPMSLPTQFHHTEHPPLCIAWFMRGSSLCNSVCDSWYLPVYSVLWHCQLHNSNGIQHLDMATLTHLMLSCSLSLTLTHTMYLECCYASVGTSYGPVSVCLSQVRSFIKMAEWIEQLFGKDASFHLFYTVLKEIQVSPKITSVLPSVTLSQTLDLENFASAYWPSKHVINLAQQGGRLSIPLSVY